MSVSSNTRCKSGKDENGKDSPKQVKCGECKKEVKESDQAVACDLCNQWFHATCGKVKPATYQALMQDRELYWYCKTCKVSVIPLQTKLQELQLKQQNLEASVKNLSKTKVDKEQVQKIIQEEMSSDHVKETVTNIAQKVVQESNQSATGSATNIKTVVSEYLTDLGEVDKRRDNIIIHNLEELTEEVEGAGSQENDDTEDKTV
jgi:hypothetical protein